MADNVWQPNNSSEINLDVLNKGIKKDKGNAEQKSVIWQINSDGVDIDLRYVSTDIFESTHKKNYWKYNWIFLILIILFGWISWLFFKYDKFIVDYSNWIETTDSSVFDLYEKAKKRVYNLLW